MSYFTQASKGSKESVARRPLPWQGQVSSPHSSTGGSVTALLLLVQVLSTFMKHMSESMPGLVTRRPSGLC